jgi:3-oxoacyl-[acyl-carrier protein] reductase
MDKLNGRTALVTGGSRGIGRAIAIALAEAGAGVALNYLSHASEAAAVAEEVRCRGRRCIVLQGDVSVAQTAAELIDAAVRGLGPVDVLVNNAGIAIPRQLDEITEADWDRTLAVNLTSCFLMTQAALPGMRSRRWGRIVNISSVAAQIGGVVGPHYAASKAGMLGLTRLYAHQLVKEGITANAIAPALIETDMVTSNLRARPELIPVGRFGLPEEVAQAAVMLATNPYITGQTINVNGGWYMS